MGTALGLKGHAAMVWGRWCCMHGTRSMGWDTRMGGTGEGDENKELWELGHREAGVETAATRGMG